MIPPRKQTTPDHQDPRGKMTRTRTRLWKRRVDLPSFAAPRTIARQASRRRRRSRAPSEMHSWQEASAGTNDGPVNTQVLRYTVPKRSQLLSPGSVQTTSFSSSSNTELFQSISFGDCAGWTKTVQPKQNALKYRMVSKDPPISKTLCAAMRLLPVTASLWLSHALVNHVRLLGPVRSSSARLTQR